MAAFLDILFQGLIVAFQAMIGNGLIDAIVNLFKGLGAA
jgi:hypothetical protein